MVGGPEETRLDCVLGSNWRSSCGKGFALMVVKVDSAGRQHSSQDRTSRGDSVLEAGSPRDDGSPLWSEGLCVDVDDHSPADMIRKCGEQDR